MSIPQEFNSSTGSSDEEQLLVAACSLLEGFTEMSSAMEGVALEQLPAGTKISVRTLNSAYQILLLDPAARRVTVQGGNLFIPPTEAIIRGSSCGGAMLKLGWIGIGLHLEFFYHPAPGETQNVVTSPVASLSFSCQ